MNKREMIEGSAIKNIHLLLDNYRQYHVSNMRSDENKLKISDYFLSNKNVFESNPQLPEMIIKTKNPYFDKNQSFFVERQNRKHSHAEKVIIKDYNPNYFFQKNLLKNENDKRWILNQSNHKIVHKDAFMNIDIELELNYEWLNQNRKWAIFVPLRDGGIFGPFGTADAYMFVSTKHKKIFPILTDFFVVDMDNECYLSTDLAITALSEEIMNTVRDIESHKYFFRHAIENHYNNPVSRMFTRESKSNKFDSTSLIV